MTRSAVSRSGKKLYETATGGDAPAQADDLLREAADHLAFANANAPDHLATYNIFGRVLIKLGRTDEARRVLEEGVRRTAAIGEGMGRDLGPAMRSCWTTCRVACQAGCAGSGVPDSSRAHAPTHPGLRSFLTAHPAWSGDRQLPVAFAPDVVAATSRTNFTTSAFSAFSDSSRWYIMCPPS